VRQSSDAVGDEMGLSGAAVVGHVQEVPVEQCLVVVGPGDGTLQVVGYPYPRHASEELCGVDTWPEGLSANPSSIINKQLEQT